MKYGVFKLGHRPGYSLALVQSKQSLNKRNEFKTYSIPTGLHDHGSSKYKCKSE